MLDRLLRFSGRYVYHEVVDNDGYRLGTLNFEPDVIYDVGANLGMFTIWAKHLFRMAKIVAVEPEPENFATLSEVCRGLAGIELIHGGIGSGPLYFHRGGDPGKHQFTSGGIGYSPQQLAADPLHIPSEVLLVDMADLIEKHGGERYVVKIDCEGAEACLLEDQRAFKALSGAAYLTIELHFWAVHPKDNEAAYFERMRWLGRFRHTHDIQMHIWAGGGMAWLTKKAK